jgi:alpha-amylase/alpha-mannosidase (GH57 family)
MSNRYFCIHGHFYQPPREDAISGVIPHETGVAPYNNWNERIHAECYKPNAELGNFEKISFNIGPTLFSWMEKFDPITYKSIIAQDNTNYAKYGVGNAMAQAYNHVILPHANKRDKLTQIKWGLADYAYRFGHPAEGMWLPETAVDIDTLEIMIDNGIKYTILAPWQADVKGLDTSKPYKVKVGRKKEIAVFFYQMDISTRISFDPGATSNADRFFVEYLLPLFKNNKKNELVIAASDGELYGHHQQFRDKFLHRLMNRPNLDKANQFTYPGRYLLEHPANAIIKIHPNTSWSCHHGVSRWAEDCDCTPGSSWKAPLRYALNTIADKLDDIYENELSRLHIDPWKIRNDYIHVILGEVNLKNFLKKYSAVSADDGIINWFKNLLESQSARQKMYTSCGWFFDEFDRIEPRNNIGNAAQATLLVEKATGQYLAEEFADCLKTVKSDRFGTNGYDVFMEYYERGHEGLVENLQFFP